jgi:site-specific DNA recombinase
LDDEVAAWVAEALRHSHTDAKQHHDEAIARLQVEYNRLQSRIDAMYLDKLDGRIDTAYFDRKASEWRLEQDRLLKPIKDHQGANQTYLEEGIQLLQLAQRAHTLFQKQEPREKRRLLNFLVSNCSWKEGQLTAVYRQPFDMLVDARLASVDRAWSFQSVGVSFENWLPGLDSN